MTAIVISALSWAGPAWAPIGGEPDPVVVEGDLNSEGVTLRASIAGIEEANKVTPIDPPLYKWVYELFTTPTVGPGGSPICDEGQRHYIAWREVTAAGVPLLGGDIGDVILFWEGGPGTPRIPGTENIPANGGVQLYDTWFVHVCVGPGTPGVEDAIQSAIPEPLAGLDPEPGFGGITGLETFAWYEQDESFGPVPDIDNITLTVRDPRYGIPYTVNAHVWATKFVWDFGDGTPPVIVSVAGSEQDLPFSAAATHVFETKDTYPVSLSVTWVGTYTYTGYTGTEVLNPTERIVAADYLVQEVVTRTVSQPAG